jgi:SAM-dependent methyltransferase
MNMKKLLAQQFRRPSGILGHYAAGFMKKNNYPYYEKMVELLDIQGCDRLLEIGCGDGRAVKLISDKSTQCRIDAIDFSNLMLRKAKKNNHQCLRDGRVRLFEGDFRIFDRFDSRYTAVFAINVVYFWDDLDEPFRKVHKLLEKNGRFIVYMSSPERIDKVPFAVKDVFNRHSLEKVMGVLIDTGFEDLNVSTGVKDGSGTFYIKAVKHQ